MNAHEFSMVEIRFFCSKDGHRRRRAGVIEAIPRGDGWDVAGGGQVLVGELPVDPRLVFGTSTRGGDPAALRAYRDRGRTRHLIQCDQCGARLLLRHKTANLVAARILAGASPRPVKDYPQFGVLSVDLSEVAASLN